MRGVGQRGRYGETNRGKSNVDGVQNASNRVEKGQDRW